MFDELKNLIFGLEKYEKVKIEDRLKEVLKITESLSVKNKEEFEVIEDVVSKLKESLRVKSSNLNKVIRDKSRNLNKNEVENLISSLNIIKYDFLDIAEREISKRENENDLVVDKKETQIKEVEDEQEEFEEIKERENVENSSSREVEQYKEFSEVQKQIKSKKIEEDSLDALLQGVDEKKKNFRTPIQNKEKIEKIEDEDVKPIIEKNPSSANIDGEPIEIEKNEEIENMLYSDEHIIVRLRNDSKVLGELLIEPKGGKNLEDLNEEEMSYAVAFSKLFAGVLFDCMQAHGTNIFWNYKENQIHIVPRFQDDGINLMWNPRTATQKELEEVKEKLINGMLDAIPKKEEEEIKKIENPKPTKREVVEAEPLNIEGEENDEDLSIKAKEIINAINKIP